MNNLAPIVLFVYNRPWHTEQTLNALSKNDLSEQSILYIYSDGAKLSSTNEQKEKIKQVRNIIRSKQWCKEVYIIESDKNKGLANSIIDGVTHVINKHGKIIVLEDDMVTSSVFLKFMNKALDYYINEKKVWHISGWIYTINITGLNDAFFWKTMDCAGGWATWENRWKYFEKNVEKLIETFSEEDIYRFNLNDTAEMWDQVISNKQGIINTWAVFWYATIFKKDGLCLSPAVSFVQNIGLDNSGVHSGSDKSLETKIVNNKDIDFSLIPIQEDKLALKRVMQFYKKNKKTYILFSIKQILKKYLPYNILVIIRNFKNRNPVKHSVELKCNFKWFGNNYGGFYICPDLLKKENQIIYSIGIGEDISFDIDIINEFPNCKIYAFDPTPKSIEWVKKQNLPKTFYFFSFGVSTKTGVEKMFLPKNKNHVSGSIIESDHLSNHDIINVNMKCIEDIIKENNHDYIDIIKLDIEGAEFSVLNKLNFKKINCGQILIEFHEMFIKNGKRKLDNTIKKLKDNGYYCFAISESGHEYSFMNIKYKNIYV
jgi:FkbM family methyltransferase